MTPSVELRLAREEELEWINQQYLQVGFTPSDREHRVVIALRDGQRAGVGRLVPVKEDSFELGGILVLENHRRQGLAGRLVRFLLELGESAGTLYCLPFAHLRDFYEGFGFRSVPSECNSLPPAIAEKLSWCRGSFESDTCLLVMERRPQSAAREQSR